MQLKRTKVDLHLIELRSLSMKPSFLFNNFSDNILLRCVSVNLLSQLEMLVFPNIERVLYAKTGISQERQNVHLTALFERQLSSPADLLQPEICADTTFCLA